MNSDREKNAPSKQILGSVLQAYRRSQRKSIFGDLLTSAREARPWRIWQSILAYFRRARAISFFFRAVGWILALLRTGTLLILTTVLFFILLPITAALVTGFLLAACSDMKKSLSRLQKAIGERPVWVFFSVGAFGAESARTLAKSGERVCLIVSPRWISSAEHGSEKFYLNLRAEGENCYLVRRYFYIRLKKKLLRSDNLALIY
jgi:hypothetical protein